MNAMASRPVQIVITAVDRTKAAFASVKTGLGNIANLARSLGGIISGLGVGLTLAGFIGSLKKAVDEMDAAAESAERVGTSVENFSALGYVAQQSGADVKILEDSLIKLSRSLETAKTGSGPAADAFAKLNIDPAKFTDPTDALIALADRFAELPDGVAKTNLAIDLFGKSGAKMIGMLNLGSDGIRRMIDEATVLGVVFEGEAAKAASEFNDSLDKLKSAGVGLGVSIANEVLPGLNEFTRVMADAAKQGGVTGAIMAGLKAGFTDYLSNTDLSGIYRLNEAQEELNSLRADGFDEDSKRIKQLKQWIVSLQGLADAEKAAEEARAGSAPDKEAALAAMELREKETEAFKAATKEQIADAKALEQALQSAFSGAVKAEEDYLRQAKKLRAESSASSVISGDAESQASASADASIAAMKLQRTASTESLQSVQDQADALRDLAGQLDDVKLKSEILAQANAAEATALEKAAAEERARYEGLATLQGQNLSDTETLKQQLEGVDKTAVVDVKPGDGLAQTKSDLTEIKHLIDYISANPVAVNVSTKGGALSGTDLGTAALQYGRR